jgi:hypothetical protein
VSFARSGLIDGHASGFEYLCWSFFEGTRDPRGAAIGPAINPVLDPAMGADCVVWANRGGGKTYLGAVATMLDLVFKAGVQVRLLAGSREQAGRMHEHLRALFERPLLRELLAKETTGQRVELRNGSRAQVLSASQRSVRGARVQKLRCDEVELFKRELWEAAQLTVRSMALVGPWGETVRGSVEALSTMHVPFGLMWSIVGESTPVGGGASGGASGGRVLFRWGVVDALEHCPPTRVCERCALVDACAGRAKQRGPQEAGHIRIDDALRARARVSSSMWESEMLCLRPSRGGSVLPEFDERVHVFDADEPRHAVTSELAARSALDDDAPVRLVAGMDFGLRSPAVVLLATLDADGVVRVWDERVESDVRLEEHVDALAKMCVRGGWAVPEGTTREAGEARTTGELSASERRAALARVSWIGVDPAGNARSEQTGVSAVTLLRRAGLQVRTRRLALTDGIELLRRRLEGRTAGTPGAGPTLFVHRRCGRLIESLMRYRYPADRPESLEPLKDGNDHAVDALRYLVINADRQASGAASYART